MLSYALQPLEYVYSLPPKEAAAPYYLPIVGCWCHYQVGHRGPNPARVWGTARLPQLLSRTSTGPLDPLPSGLGPQGTQLPWCATGRQGSSPDAGEAISSKGGLSHSCCLIHTFVVERQHYPLYFLQEIDLSFITVLQCLGKGSHLMYLYPLKLCLYPYQIIS